MGNQASAEGDEPPSHPSVKKPSSSPQSPKQPKRRDSVQAYPPKATPATGTTAASALGESSKGPRGGDQGDRARATTVSPPQNISKTTAMGNSGSAGDERAAPTSSDSKPSPSKPIPVPQRAGSQKARPPSPEFIPVRPASHTSQQHRHASIGYGDPPRLPLPIQEEDVDPGSPVPSQEELLGHVSDLEIDEDSMARKYSMSTAAEDDEDETFHPPKPSKEVKMIPTLIEWREPGATTVFVSGTFADFWQKKYKLSMNGPSPIQGAHSAMIDLEDRAVHHITFLVDGRMKVADHLPTTVDFTNTIVNYIDLIPKKERGRDDSRRLSGVKQSDGDLEKVPELDKAESSRSPSPIFEPDEPDETRKKPVAEVYHQEIPQYLIDSELKEGDPRYERSQDLLHMLSDPPTLPMWLTRSVLNYPTPKKDDASVLLNPNHTVINHLATSSIKNGVIATSVTTRYKSKFLTTIYYKPTSDEE